MNRNSLAIRLSAFVASLLIASTASAGPLGSDPTGMAGFTGTVSFNASNLLLVDLDYAVFEPGVYPNDGINGIDPSNGTEYVYAYQAFNVSPVWPLTTVSVGVGDPALSGAHNAMADPLHVQTGGIAPSTILVSQGSESFFNSFINPVVGPGEFSTVLLFTSPVWPRWMPTRGSSMRSRQTTWT